MVSKNNKKMLEEKMRDEKQRFSIRKFSIGAASVLIGLSFMAGGQSVSAATRDDKPQAAVSTTTNANANPENTDKKTNAEGVNASEASQSQTDENTVAASVKDKNTTEEAKNEKAVDSRQVNASEGQLKDEIGGGIF